LKPVAGALPPPPALPPSWGEQNKSLADNARRRSGAQQVWTAQIPKLTVRQITVRQINASSGGLGLQAEKVPALKFAMWLSK